MVSKGKQVSQPQAFQVVVTCYILEAIHRSHVVISYGKDDFRLELNSPLHNNNNNREADELQNDIQANK